MKIDKKRQVLFFVSLIGIVVTSIVMGTTYAYQTLIVDYKEESNNIVEINSGKLNISYERTNKININNMTILPDYKTADYTEFTIKSNDTSYDVAYQINLIDLVYSSGLSTKAFKYTITKLDGNVEYVIGEGDFSTLSDTEFNLSFNMSRYRVLEKEKNETLRLYIWLKENENLTGIEESNFKGKIEIVSMFSNEINETIYKKLNVYGNSVQDGIPSTDNPILIQSLGTKVNDASSLNNGKYKIPLKISSKNLIEYPYQDTTKSVNGLTFIDNKDGSITIDGTASKETIFNIKTSIGTIWENLVPGKNYTASIKLDGTDKQLVSIVINYYPESTTDLLNYTRWMGTIGNKATSLCPNDISGLRVYLHIAEGVTLNNVTVWFQLEEGTSATEIKSYFKTINTDIYLDEPLRKVGGVSDYIDFVNQTVVRNVKVIEDSGVDLLENSYVPLSLSKYDYLGKYKIPYMDGEVITACSENGVCSSNIEIETNK